MTEQSKRCRIFTFVNVTDPYQAEQAGTRKRVRSAAASDGWAVSKEPTLRSSSAKNAPLPDRNSVPILLSEWSSDAVSRQHSETPDHSDKDSSSSSSSSSSSISSRSTALSRPSVLSIATTSSTSTLQYDHGRKRKADSSVTPREHSPFLHSSSSPGVGILNPFSTYQIGTKPWFKSLMHHFYESMAPRVTAIIDVTPEQSRSYMYYTHQLMMHEPALFYMRLFTSASQLVSEGRLKRDIALWLRIQTIRSIQEALIDPARLPGKGLIVTVRLIAIHECVFGDRTASLKVHRPALTRLIDMAGGIESWDSLPVEKELTIWYDKFIARMTGTPRVWEEDNSLPVLDSHVQTVSAMRNRGEI